MVKQEVKNDIFNGIEGVRDHLQRIQNIYKGYA
jgi:hypothetical protein